MKPITIVGGGLAGLTLGIALRQRDVPVQVLEAGSYPRHRVCGEFISGQGEQSLQRFELLHLLREAGAQTISTMALYSERGRVFAGELPRPGIALSRYTLDALLASEFQLQGGVLQTGVRWNRKSNSEPEEGLVMACGRRPQPARDGWRWFGLKAHAWEIPLEAGLEMHKRSDGYVGLANLGSGVVNICGLFRSRTALGQIRSDWKRILAGEEGTLLHTKVSGAVLDETSFCSSAGIAFGYMEERSVGLLVLGDALGFSPPLTGNGMSMALESAEMAVDPLVKYASDEIGWSEVLERVSRALRLRFKRRLWRAQALQLAAFHPWAGSWLEKGLRIFPDLLPLLFSKTR